MESRPGRPVVDYGGRWAERRRMRRRRLRWRGPCIALSPPCVRGHNTGVAQQPISGGVHVAFETSEGVVGETRAAARQGSQQALVLGAGIAGRVPSWRSRRGGGGGGEGGGIGGRSSVWDSDLDARSRGGGS